MADPLSDFINTIFSGTTGGVPNIYLIVAAIGVVFGVYWLMSRPPSQKKFKALDLKKETKRRFKREYKFFGKPLNKPIYDTDDNVLAYVIGYMKVVEMKQLKRIEPIYSNFGRQELVKKRMELAMQIYEKDYNDLDAVQKKNIIEAAKDELRESKIETIAQDDKTKIRRGKKETITYEPIAMYMLKFCSNSLISKLAARLLGFGTEWALFDKGQLKFEVDRVQLTANLQIRTPYDVFVFSEAGKKRLEDISFGADREAQLQAIANQTSKVNFFDTELGRQIEIKREESRLEAEKRRRQSESHDMR